MILKRDDTGLLSRYHTGGGRHRRPPTSRGLRRRIASLSRAPVVNDGRLDDVGSGATARQRDLLADAEAFEDVAQQIVGGATARHFLKALEAFLHVGQQKLFGQGASGLGDGKPAAHE